MVQHAVWRSAALPVGSMPFGAVPPSLVTAEPDMPQDTRGMRAMVVVDWALCLWYVGCVFMGDCGKLWEIVGNCGKLWEILRYCAFSKHLITSQKIPKILIIPSSTRPVCVPHPVMLHLCSLQRFCLHEGIGNRSTVSSPHTPQPLRTHFPSGFSATVSTAVCAGCSVGRPTTASGLYRLRPAGLPGRSFHCTPGLCSVFLSRSQK